MHHYKKLCFVLLGIVLCIAPPMANARPFPVACSGQNQTPNLIRNEGKTEQIADYFFSCYNYGEASAVTVSATISLTAAITSRNLMGGVTEAALIVQDSIGQQPQQTILGTVSGNIVTFSFTLPQSTNYSSYQPFNLTITNIRVDATPLAAASTLSETVSVSGDNVNPTTFETAQIAQVQPGLGPQSVTGTVNFPVCSTVTTAAPAFTVKFGENSLSSAAFKTPGGSGNTNVGDWAANNTETGYFLQNDGVPLNMANSGTRLRILFTNIPNNISVYVPLTIASDQLVEISPAGTLGLTASEAGPYSIPGYNIGNGLAQLTVTNGTAEAVYEVLSDSANVVESYGIPVYLASSGAVSPQAAMRAGVSFAPVGAASNIPNFAQVPVANPFNVSQFPPCLMITSATLPNAVLTLAYNQTVGVSGGVAPYTWSLPNGSALPSPLVLNAATGAITGYPGSVGPSSFTIKVADSSGQSATQAYSFYVDPAVAISSAYRVADATVGETYSATLTATGGYGVYTWALTGTLQQQTGLTFSNAGVISGTPNASGFYTAFSATVTDSSGGTANTPINILINPALRITTTSLPVGVAGTAYPMTSASSSGGSGTNVWSIVSGSLTGTGLSFSPQGVFSGTPLAQGSIGLTLKVTDQGGGSVTQPVTITVNPALALPTTPPLPTGVQGVYYTQQLPSTGGSGSNQWLLADRGTLPSGISLSSGGLLSGTSATSGVFTFTARVTDSYSDVVSQLLTLQVNPPVTFTTGATLPGTIDATPYTTTLAATGGLGSYTFSSTGVQYPLMLNYATGVISGTTNTPGILSFSVTVTDSSGSSAMQQFTLLVSPSLYLNFVSIVDESSPLGYFRLETLSGSSEVNSYTYSASEGGAMLVAGVPDGVTNNNAVKLNGASGYVTTNLAGGVNTAGSVMAWVDMSALPSALSQVEYVAGESQNGNDFDLQFTTDNILRFYTTNANQNLSYTPTVGTLLNQWHMIVATFDNTAGQRAIYWDGQLVATDTVQSLTNKTGAFEIGNSSVFGGRYFDGAIDEAAVWSYALTPSQIAQIYTEANGRLPNGTQNQTYGPYTFAAAAGSGTYTYTATGVPSGLTLSSAGVLSGQPAAAAASYVTVRATDTVTSQTSSLGLLLTVSAPVTITPTTLSAAVVNVPYTRTLTASGGSGTGYQFTLAMGSTLPAGLSLSSAGVLIGTPQVSGGTSFTVVATDSNATPGQQVFSLTVDPAVAFTTSGALPAAMPGVAYSQTLAATGGFGSYTWSVATASLLPSWLSLNASTGALTGTPAGSANYSFVLMVLDSSGSAATRTFSLTASAPPLSIITTTLPAATQGVPYNGTLSVTGGAGAYTWSVTDGTFTNAGFALNPSTGAITGTPVTADTLTFTVQVSDGFGGTAFQTLHLFINLASPATHDFAVADQGSDIQRVSADGTRTSAICTGAACHPQDIVADAQGVIYTHDNQGIAKITPAGVVTQLVSFSGNPIFGEGGAGVGGIALDGLGNIIFVDNRLDAVFRVATDGTGLVQVAAFPVASPGESQDTYVAIDHLGNYVVVSDDDGVTKVYIFTPSGAVTTLGTFECRGAAGVAVDAAGNVIFTDFLNYQIVSVDPSGQLTVLAQTYCCSLRGLTLDSAPGQFITGSYGGALLRLTQTGAVTTIVNGTPLTLPVSVASIPLLTTGPLTVSPSLLASGMVGQSYGPYTMSASGGSGSYAWTATGLPSGVAISGAGVVSGVPSALGSYSAQITATDSLTAQTGGANITIVIAPAIGPLTITGGATAFGIALGTALNTTYTAAGGVTPYSWNWTGLLPPGVTLTSGGVLSGLITQPGIYSFNVQVNDIEPVSMAEAVTVSVLGLTTTSLPGAAATAAYSATVGAAGGTAPYTFTATGLPTGLSISAAGVISGRTGLTGPFSVAITVTDSNRLSSTSMLSLMVSASPVSVSTSSLPNAAVGIRYAQTLSAAGGASPYTWAVDGGGLPSGLSLSAAGVVSGNPTAGGSMSVTVKATDSNGASATVLLTVTVYSAVIVTPTTLPGGTVGQPYGPITAAATGGSGSVTWSSTGLPAGVSLGASTGTISGTPSVGGPFTATVTASDTVTGQTGSQNYSANISYAALTITSSGSLGTVAVGSSLSTTFAATGGKTPYTWSSTGTLPSGVTLSAAGALTGTVTQAGNFTFTAQVTDAQPVTTPLTVTGSALGITTTSLSNSTTVNAAGGVTPYTFTGTGFPAGLSISTAGVISGTTAATGTVSVVVTVTDANRVSATATLPLTVIASPVSVSTSSPPNAAVGIAYSQALSAAGGAQPYTWTLANGALPAGLSLNTAGTISGNPTQGGPASFTVKATDNNGASATAVLSIMVYNAVTVTTASLPGGTVGQAYGPVTMAAAGGSGSITWSSTGLPAGVSLGASTGTISGTPSAGGPFSAAVTATDKVTGQTGSQNYTGNISYAALTITSSGALGTVAAGTALSTTFAATGGKPPYTWATTGTLPSGVTLSVAGALTGAVTQAGNYTFTAQVTDAQPVTTPLTVTGSVLGITTASLTNSTQVSAAGGVTPYTFAGTGFPAGLSISTAGLISGATTATGPVPVTITVTDANRVSATATLALTVTPSPVSVSTSSLPNAAAGIAYSQTLAAAGGSQPYTWTLASGALPAGLSLSTAGVVSGNPTASGSFPITVKATDTNGASGTAMLSISVAAAVTIALPTLPTGSINQTYGPVVASATGGSGTYTWTATGLPSGISIAAATGSIGGIPSVSGSFGGTITATDTTTHQTAMQPFSLSVAGYPALSITSGASPAPVALGGSVSGTFGASGGNPPYTWTASGLPANVTLSAGGVLSGVPSQAGVFTASVTVTDSQPASVGASITVSVFGLTSASLPGGVTGQFYSASIGAAGGTAPYSFSATGLPAGLSLSAAGNLTGTAAAANTYSFTVNASDSGGLSVSAGFSLTIGKPQPISISSGVLASGTVNIPYSQSLSASGGTATYTWALSAGALPAGLSLNSSGTLSGIPTTPGTFSFGVMATDGAGAIATTTISVTVQAAPLTITTQSVPSGVNGLGYPQQVLGASGGVLPYTWAVTAGSLPTGIGLSRDGTLTGIPTATGSFPVTITATDKAGATGSVNLSLTTRPAATADLILSSNSLSFALMTPSMVTPPSQATGVQSTRSSQQIPYAISVSPAAPWLTVTNGSTTPDTLQVSIAAAALTLLPGDYTTTIAVACSSGGCAGNTQSVSVELKVTAAPPRLQVVTDLLSFGAMTSNPQSMSQSITIQNAGGGTIGIGGVSCEAAWCTAGTGVAALPGGASGSISVSVNPALLTAGFFRTQVDIATSAGTASVPVTVLVAADSTMTLAPVGTQFTMQAGGAPGNASGSFLVSVTNSAAVNWSASVLSGSPWLTLSTTAGASSASAPGAVSYAIDPVGAAALAPGVYYGQIAVTSSGTVNSPLSFEVVLIVSPVSVAVIPDPEPAGLLFITTVGGAAPPQIITVYSGSTALSGFQASATTSSGGAWLSVSPQIGNSASGAPGMTTVTVNTAGLKQGVYTGGVSYSLTATAVRVVNVTLIVTPVGAGAAPHAVSPKDGRNCTPSVLVPVQTGLVNNFSAAVAWPTPLTVVLANDCGSLINSGQLVATFSNGDPPLPLALADPSKSLYSGTWTPRKSVAQMTVIAHASAAGYPEATAQVVGAATPNSAPLLTPHGTLHSFDPLVGAALAPGTIIQIYGQNLASQTFQPTTIPLPTAMNGTSVIVGGIPAPLYYVSAGQINAQLPFDLTAGNQYQVLISANGALTTPDTVQLSAATPGLAAFADSTLIAQHGDGTLVSATAPAKPGEYLVAYLAGMGGTNATPASGAASPGSPLALPALTPVLTLNGAVYPIAFAGLTPGLVGLYQMNFQVPAGLPAGNLTLVVNQNGALSNRTVLPYAP